MDGVSIRASAWNEVAILPNTEGIQEVKTNINNMSAEYGRSQGTVGFTTKSGTNPFHASGQFRLGNKALNANSFSNKTRVLALTVWGAGSTPGGNAFANSVLVLGRRTGTGPQAGPRFF